MKMALSFISGIIVCSTLLFGASVIIPSLAKGNVEEASENLTQSLTDLLPDIERIYQESLTLPFRKAEDKIYDEDIAEFYHELMYNSLLSEP